MSKKQQKEQFFKEFSELLKGLQDKYGDTEGIGIIAIGLKVNEDNSTDSCISALGTDDILLESTLDLMSNEALEAHFLASAMVMAREEKKILEASKQNVNNFNVN